MRYQWGPLLRDGGERRLNVAATRAKHRLTVVSAFSSHDVDPDRLTKAGARLLAEYLEYAGSGGTPMAAAGPRPPTRSRRPSARGWRSTASPSSRSTAWAATASTWPPRIPTTRPG
jgi:hypothetical protein